MKYFIANWKANKNLAEAASYMDILLQTISKNTALLERLEKNEIKIILAPPFPFLFTLKEKIKSAKNIHLAAQDISHFEDGAYTGEITGRMLQGLVDFAIVAHSERRKYFAEKDDVLFKKAQLAQKYGLQSIYGLRDEHDRIPAGVGIVAYEPNAAIGTGKNEPVKNVLRIKEILNLPKNTSYLYGGSVNRENAALYLKTGKIDGFLVGSASLDPIHFIDLIPS